MINRTFKHEGARCDVKTIAPGILVLSGLYSHHRQQGHARALMEKVVAFADENRLNIKLRVREFGPPDVMTDIQLFEFYTKFGFKMDVDLAHKTDMTREHSQELQRS